jgi:3-methylcrotonyl-CoA carboxylase alpha subunit
LDETSSQSPFEILKGFRLWNNEPNRLKFLLGSEVREFTLDKKYNHFTAIAASESLDFSLLYKDKEAVRLDCGDRVVSLSFFHHDNLISIAADGARYDFGLLTEVAEAGEGDGADLIVSPVPGLVRKISMAAGQNVRRGETVIIVEAMKMEFSLKADRDGLIREIHVSEGQQIAEGTQLVTIGDESG